MQEGIIKVCGEVCSGSTTSFLKALKCWLQSAASSRMVALCSIIVISLSPSMSSVEAFRRVTRLFNFPSRILFHRSEIRTFEIHY